MRSAAGLSALKHVFDPVAERDVREEVDFAMAVRSAGVSTPAIVSTVDGHVLLDVGGRQYRVSEWVELDEPDIGLDPAAVGALVARIHTAGFVGERPQDPWYVDRVGAARWDELIVLLREAGAPFADRLAEIRDDILAVESLLAPASHLQTCHRDLWADNLRSTPSGELCVFDWESCGLADPSGEVALTLYEFAYDDPSRAVALYDAYLAAGGPGRVTAPGDFSMVIAQVGHIGEIGCRRWLEAPPASRARARNAGRFAEFSTRRLTCQVIDALLDAVRR